MEGWIVRGMSLSVWVNKWVDGETDNDKSLHLLSTSSGEILKLRGSGQVEFIQLRI